MPTLTRHHNLLYRTLDNYPLCIGEEHVPCTERLCAFVAEHAATGAAGPSEYVQLEDGTYDLHPDIRFAPGDRVPA